MARLINKNLAILRYALQNNYRGVALEGGSRSGKTIASVDFQIYLASHFTNQLVINNIRETYNSFKTTLWDDYNKRLTDFGLQSPFAAKDVTTFNLLGHKVNFIGADKLGKVHGMGSDFFYVNEALEGIDKAFFDQMEQRCRMMWWVDYNPSASDHWVFDLEKRKDVLFLRTTLLDNPYIPYNQKKKILSYDPSVQENIENGTADDYMWKVYGLGLRASPEGLIFQNVKIIYELPEDYEYEYFGIDFGFTNDPTAIPRIRRKGNNIYVKLHVYTPIDNPEDLYSVIVGIDPTATYWADRSDKKNGEDPVGMITSLRRKGLSVHPAPKFPGSINTGITVLKGFNIFIVDDPDARKEINNYKWRTINGISLNEPVDKYNHMWDAIRGVALANFIE